MNYKQEDFTYKADTSNPAVLGVLEGPVADIVNPTRNGRKYSETLWEKVFNSPIVKEKLACGGIFGESQHPVDRQEVDTEKIAIAMKEAPVKHDDGKLYARFYILDTPCGRILKTLADFGYKIGISSRGSGDTYTDADGNEVVDEDTYDFETFDAVLLPSVKEARMQVVNEGLDENTLKLKKALNESLEKATPDERKVMEEALDNLHISYKQQDAVNINEVSEAKAVENSEAIVAELQEALKKVKHLEAKVLDLQEKLSVSYTKEAKVDEQVQRYKKAITKLNEQASTATKLSELNEKLNRDLEKRNTQIKQLQMSIRKQHNVITESVNSTDNLKQRLQESNKKIANLTTNNNQLQESFATKTKALNEKIEGLQKDLDINRKQYSEKLDKSQKLVEKYRNIAQVSVDRYIKSQAVRLGVSVNEIKNRLNESYTFDDIDEVCESLQSYKLNMSKLPFASLKENVQVKINPSVNEKLPVKRNDVDDVDEDLLRLANLH